MATDPAAVQAALAVRIVACLPGRMPGRQVTALAAELGADVYEVQAELLEMERAGQVLRGQRRGSQRWCRGLPAPVEGASDDQASLF